MVVCPSCQEEVAKAEIGKHYRSFHQAITDSVMTEYAIGNPVERGECACGCK